MEKILVLIAFRKHLPFGFGGKMKKNRVLNKFILESIATLLPLCVTYFLLGMWLSDVTDFGRYYTDPPTALTYGWIEFDTLGQGFKNYSFEIAKLFWIGFILAVLLIILGRLLTLGVIKIMAKKIKV